MNYNHQVATQSFYIHWPFCPYKCHFCPFVAFAGQEQFMERYNRALCAELKSFGVLHEKPLALDTIYLGGGTPSTYPDVLLLDMFGTLEQITKLQPGYEITIEVNPGTVKEQQWSLWKGIGINRISIGVQSLNNKVLKNLNRHQLSEDVHRVVDQAHKIFDNISVDIIIGLPGVSHNEWKALLHQVVAWPITHVSMYFLTIHEHTPLYVRVKKQEIVLPEDDALVDLYAWSVDYLAEYGFEQYELSSFARAGYQSRHNKVYWSRKPYKGFGVGACFFDGMVRFQNEKNLSLYMRICEQGGSPVVHSELLTPEQTIVEKIMLGIRQAQGLVIQEIF